MRPLGNRCAADAQCTCTRADVPKRAAIQCLRAVSVAGSHTLLTSPAARRRRMQTPAPQEPAPLEPAPGNRVVVISTSLGDVTVELFNDKAPVSVENFLSYATEGFYSGTVFHRVVSGFVVQGGGYTADHGGEADAPADPERGDQRAAQPPRDGRHGAHPEPAERDVAVLLQRVQQPGPRSPGILARATSATPSSAACSRGWTSSTGSRACRPHSSAGMDDVPVEPVLDHGRQGRSLSGGA